MLRRWQDAFIAAIAPTVARFDNYHAYRARDVFDRYGVRYSYHQAGGGAQGWLLVMLLI